jgi:hypothetical protein
MNYPPRKDWTELRAGGFKSEAACHECDRSKRGKYLFTIIDGFGYYLCPPCGNKILGPRNPRRTKTTQDFLNQIKRELDRINSSVHKIEDLLILCAPTSNSKQ